MGCCGHRRRHHLRFLDRARGDAVASGVAPMYVEGDLRDLPVATGAFDAAVSWFTSFGYFDEDDNRRVLSEYRRVVRPGGALLIETLNPTSLVRRLQPTPSRINGDNVMVDTCTVDVLTGTIETERMVIWEGRVHRSHHSVRLYTVPELRALLNAAGFPELQVTTRHGEPLTMDSHRLVIVAR